MPNDAKLGLMAGMAAVLAAAMMYAPKGAATGAAPTAAVPAQTAAATAVAAVPADLPPPRAAVPVERGPTPRMPATAVAGARGKPEVDGTATARKAKRAGN